MLQDNESGLFICLKTFAGLGRDHVERYYRKTGYSVFLHMLRDKIEVYLLSSKYYVYFSLLIIIIYINTCQL